MLLQASREGMIDESKYDQIVFKKRDWLSQKKSKQLKSIHLSLSKGIKYRRAFESKEEVLKKIENEFMECRPEFKMRVRNKANKNNILIP